MASDRPKRLVRWPENDLFLCPFVVTMIHLMSPFKFTYTVNTLFGLNWVCMFFIYTVYSALCLKTCLINPLNINEITDEALSRLYRHNSNAPA